VIRVHSIPPEPSQNFVREKGFNRARAKQDVFMIILRWKVFMEHA